MNIFFTPFFHIYIFGACIFKFLKEGVFTGIVFIVDDSSVEGETGLPNTTTLNTEHSFREHLLTPFYAQQVAKMKCTKLIIGDNTRYQVALTNTFSLE